MNNLEKIRSAIAHCFPETPEEEKLTCDTCPLYPCDDEETITLPVSLGRLIRECEPTPCSDCTRHDALAEFCNMHGIPVSDDDYCSMAHPISRGR